MRAQKLSRWMCLSSLSLFSILTVALIWSSCSKSTVAKVTTVEVRNTIPKNVILSHYRISVPLVNIFNGGAIEVKPIATAVGIGPKRLITAGHAIPALDCPIFLDIFDTSGKVEKQIRLKVIGVTTSDFAILESEEVIPHYVQVATNEEFEKLEIGDPVYIIGAKFALAPYNINTGFITSKYLDECPNYWLTSAEAAPGNSGGGIYDAKTHKLIGIVVRSVNGLNSAIVPLNVIRTL